MPNSNESLLHHLAHELRQPLSTIESIAYYLELALPHSDARVLEQLTRLRHLVEQSGWILNDTLAIAKTPAGKPEIVDLDELLSEFVYEQMQHDSNRPHFELALAGAPAWMDYRHGRELVYAVCRLFRTLARPGSEVEIFTRSLPGGRVLLQAKGKGHIGEEGSLPPGTQLTIDWIEKIAQQNAATVMIRLADPERLELLVEVPAAQLGHELPAVVDEVHPSFEAVCQPGQVAQGIL
jgi:hypothetical protein